jgi:hypothetical protein
MHKAKINALFAAMVMMVIIGGIAAWAKLTSDHCVGNPSAQAASFRGDKECPAIGNVDGVKLAIPRAYLFGPVTYKGDDIWKTTSAGGRKRRPSFANEIENFGILVRLSDFRPIETQRDREDYQNVESRMGPAVLPPQNRWILVGVNSSAAYISPDCRSGMRCYFEGSRKDDLFEQTHERPTARTAGIL